MPTTFSTSPAIESILFSARQVAMPLDTGPFQKPLHYIKGHTDTMLFESWARDPLGHACEP